jgi:hypothetical protein
MKAATGRTLSFRTDLIASLSPPPVIAWPITWSGSPDLMSPHTQDRKEQAQRSDRQWHSHGAFDDPRENAERGHMNR